MKPIIEVQQLSKTFRLGQRPARYLSLRDRLSSVFQKSALQNEVFYALQDINFKLSAGDTLGVIGRNGAGKSTLLKIISKITPPTSGRIILRGRVSSLLEVGTGFHPELSGRENIFLNGSILGLKNREIKSKFDEIVDFAGVEPFIDTPVKHFSTGMQMRLAFSVAAHLEPEILLIDEVLSVGDAKFQEKCIGKMEEVAKDQGRTIIFVSHDLSSVAKLTSQALLLDQGKIISRGATAQVIADYQNSFSQVSDYKAQNAPKDIPHIANISLRTSEGTSIQAYYHAMDIIFDIHVPKSIKGLAISYQIFSIENQALTLALLSDRDISFGHSPGNYLLEAHIEKLRLAPGKYFFKVHFANHITGEKFETLEAVCPFEVINLSPTRVYPMVKGEAFYYEDNQWNVHKSNAVDL